MNQSNIPIHAEFHTYLSSFDETIALHDDVKNLKVELELRLNLLIE
jgi:hypothetical protein